MSSKTLTRRSFVAGSAGVAALAAGACFSGIHGACWYESEAWAEDANSDKSARTVHTLCAACPSRCGYTAYVHKGKVGKLIADTNHPNAKGSLCAAGYGYAQVAYSEDRTKHPLKKNASGDFDEISWEAALSEIAEKIAQIKNDKGASALAVIHDGEPTARFYAPRFAHALGSANVYTAQGSAALSTEAGLIQAIGAPSYRSDVEHSKMTITIGASYSEGANPARDAETQKAHDKGAKLVAVDPRLSDAMASVDEWVPVNPGTELAFVLALAHVIIGHGAYDAAYIQANSDGFDSWRRQIGSYTPKWAERITGISADTIERIAGELADAAPAASLEIGWNSGLGSAYRNSGETARAIALVNTLLGCWNHEGGAIIPQTFKPAETIDRLAPIPEPENQRLGDEQYPLVTEDGSIAHAIDSARTHKISAMLVHDVDVATGCTNPKYAIDALTELELLVAITGKMTKTACMADYVLPENTFLDRTELPDFIAAPTPVVAQRSQVLDGAEDAGSEAKSPAEIYALLAKACGQENKFAFTLDEICAAQLEGTGISVTELAQAGVVPVTAKAVTYGDVPEWHTPTGKIQFASQACAEAGLTAAPSWVEPAVTPSEGDGEMRLITGSAPVVSNEKTTDVEPIMNIMKSYELYKAWIHPDAASQAGIEDGDKIWLTNDQYSTQIPVKITARINPKAIFIPSHFGCASPEMKVAYDVGVNALNFVPFGIEPAYGSFMNQETLVKLQKAGA